MKDFKDYSGLLSSEVSRRVFLKLCAAAGVSASVAASPQRVFSDQIKRGIVINQIHTLENDYFVNWDVGIKEAINALGLEYRLFLHEGDSNKQFAQVDQAAVVGAKMMVCNVATEGALPVLAKTAQRNGIYFSNIWDIPQWFTPLLVGDHYVMYQTPLSEQIGYDVAKTLFKKIGGKGTVGVIRGMLGASADWQRDRGMRKAAKEFPEIKLVGDLPGNWNRIDGRKVMEDYLTTYPEMDGVYAQNDSEAMGALEALKERKITGIPVIGIDGNEEAVRKVAEGQLLATHLTVPGYQSGWAAVNVFDALNGWKPSLPERMMFTGSILITKENAQYYYDKVYGGKGGKLPYDWLKMSRVLQPDDWDPQNEITPINPWEFWKGFEQTFTLPDEYEKAREKGEWERVSNLYRDHYKMKL
jgi:ribose transport system substrate-binding protein